MESIKDFITVSSGSGYGAGDGYDDGYDDGAGDGAGYGAGYGYGDGYGEGSGSGSGNGCGSGSVDGCGSGSGSGNGYGAGYGVGDGSGDGSGLDIAKINNLDVHLIDNLPTVITRRKGKVARGYILNNDLSMNKCYVIKHNNIFAHGETLHEARQALDAKLFEELDVEERISLFLEKFNGCDKYPAKEFFDWHNKLTGSCEMGRTAFAKNHNINLEKDEFTVDEFIELTESDYQGEIIKLLKNEIERGRKSE